MRLEVQHGPLARLGHDALHHPGQLGDAETSAAVRVVLRERVRQAGAVGLEVGV
eukprot:CAMPEP_0198221174 /NCGR_PEP_ID=MMETSP1445-20131203/82515_1 /TAXON_ID=36898 /ORGANISM="Pyramimonas sp., Strain CCMP2087" /LENGTH=53 /DNA_ID=CAMNT_0043899219 /DNA_START=64 /DNA_END=225 /DNA_ORIENTATION=+